MPIAHRVLFIGAFALACAGQAAAHSGESTSDSARGQEVSTAEAPPRPDVPGLDDLTPGRIVLLREGSTLLRARGTIERDEKQIWRFVLSETDTAEQQTPIRLHLLPSQQLAEMERLAELETGAIERSIFEVTGEVFVYRGRNFLLPTFAPRIVGAAQTRTVPADPPTDDAASQADNRRDLTDNTDDDDYVEQIMRDLEASVGDIPRAAPRAIGAGGDEPPLVRDGERLINRRGRLRTDERGAWVFVFEADATGLSDPPMALLPCLLLEELIELQNTRLHESGSRPPLLISGVVTTYHGRNYLLPSMYRLPRNATPISR